MLVPRLCLALVLAAGSACAQRAGPREPLTRLDLVADSTLLEAGPQVQRAWQLYALVKAQVIETTPRGLDDYWIEVGSRESLAEYWDDEREQEGRESDAYLDALAAVRRAGHMEEYVLATLVKPGWTIPEDMLAELDIAAFREWSKVHLAGHEVETKTGVRKAGSDLSPPIPGDELPSVGELLRNGSPCAELPQLASGYAAWREREAQLPGVGLAGRDRADFVQRLAVLQRTAPGRHVTWVSPKAADVSYLAGFCEVDRNRYAASVDALETAVRLDPLAPMWRLELVGSLTDVKRFDDAAREIELVLAQTEDRCTLGAAWRKKGFLEIERGQLEQAELAYRKSLDYEPGNDIALSELKIILDQRMERGDGPPAPYAPPPATAPMQRSCPGR